MSRFARGLSATVMGMTLAVTSPALAAEPTPAEVPAAAPAPAAPLPVRPSKPLELAPASTSSGTGWKILAGLAVAAGAFFYVKKKQTEKKATNASVAIDLLGRVSVGVRSELLVVEADGQRLLLGMTPNNIQTLAVLDATPVRVMAGETAADVGGPGEAAEGAAEGSKTRDATPRELAISAKALDDRVRSLFSSPGSSPGTSAGAQSESRTAAASAETRSVKKVRPVAGQARGLRSALEDDHK